MNPTLQYPDQEYGAGSDLTLAAQEYSATAIVKYNTALKYGQWVMTAPAKPGTRAKHMTAIADSEAEDLPRGTERAGSNQPESEGRVITLDTLQLIADHYRDEVADFINHVNTREAYAVKDGQAVAATVDKRLSACISIGARVAARQTGADQQLGGISITADTAGAVTTAYPLSLAGSRELQDDFGEMAQTMDEQNVSPEGRVAFVTPYLARVLRQDKTLLSGDFQTLNDLLTRKLLMVEGFMVEVTNNMCQSDWSSYGQANYADQTLLGTAVSCDFTKVVAQFLGAPDGIGQLIAYGGVRPFGPTWIDDKHSWYYGTKIWQGAGPIRPEVCGELVLQ